tara:strand:+ start:449 stop:1093 length:645 start_codon:yes stop_codon:yes gene_type:complete
MDVAIIDYQMSNLHSVQAACNKVGLSSVITSESNQILDAKISILPGVGAFGEAMSQLSKSKLDDCIYRFVVSGRPFIGICLGLQLLFETSEEFGDHKGLGLIRGTVKKFQFSKIESTKYPVPQVGWNQIQKITCSWDGTFMCNNKNGDFMYFVHSYYVNPEDKDVILSTTTYGNREYCSAIQYNNIFATQFHPEKSGEIGMKIYQNLKNNLEGK